MDLMSASADLESLPHACQTVQMLANSAMDEQRREKVA